MSTKGTLVAIKREEGGRKELLKITKNCSLLFRGLIDLYEMHWIQASMQILPMYGEAWLRVLIEILSPLVCSPSTYFPYSRYPYIASEVLSCEIFAIVDAILSNPEELLQPFWDAVLTSNPTPAQAPIPHHSHPLLATPNEPASNSNSSNDASEITKLNSDQSSTDSKESKDSRSTCALENGPGRSVLAGYWAKVNGVFLDKKPREVRNLR